MATLREWLSRLWGSVRGRRPDRDLEEELRLHLELAEEEAGRRGDSADAVRRSRLDAGGVSQAMDALRDQRGLPWLEELTHDTRHGLRSLRRSPVFTTVALITVALGIGANSAIFSVLRATSLRTAGLPDPDRLAIVWTTPPGQASAREGARIVEYFAWKERAGSFSEVGAMLPWSSTLGSIRDAEPAERLSGWRFTASAFRALGVAPQLGRVLTDADMPVDGPNDTVVISDRLWRSHFDADPDVLGRTILLDGTTTTIVGVMPPQFWAYTNQPDFWIGMGFTRFQLQARSPNRVLTIIGRLARSTSLEAAEGDLERIAAQLAHEEPGPQQGRGIAIQPLESALFGNVQRSLLVLQGAVGFVLLIACANVAGLLLTRATARQRDVAIRTSLGAGRGRLVRLLLTESLILSLGGGAMGVAIAWYALHVLRGADPTWLPRVSQAHMDLTVLACTAVVSMLTGLGFGLAPALGLARPDLVLQLKDSGHGIPGSPRGRQLQGALLVGQVALTLVLLVGAGLLMRSFWHLQRHDLGFDATDVLAFDTRLPAAAYYRMVGTANGFTQLDVSPVPAQLFQRIREQLLAGPGVRAAAGTNEPPAGGGGLPASFTIEGRERESGGGADAWSANYALVTPDFFHVLRIPVQRGREFSEKDTVSSLPVAIINESMARRFWPNDDPIGKRLTVTIVPGERPREIVGVVGDTALSRWDRAPAPALYVPHAQESTRSRTPYGQSRLQMTFVLRIDRPLEVVLPAVRRAVAEVDPDIPVSRMQLLAAGLAQQVEAPRDSMVLVAAFGAVALLLALCGLYGNVAYGVAQRAHEIAVRMVLGASRGEVLRLTLGRFTGLTTAGMLVGLVGAMALTRYLDGLLFEVTSLDTMTFVVVPMLFVVVAGVAALVPARRAATLDPQAVLRSD